MCLNLMLIDWRRIHVSVLTIERGLFYLMRIQSSMLVLGTVTLLAALLRLYGLGDRCLWLDETFAWRATQFTMGEMLSRWSNPFVAENPPLFPMLLNGWVRFFGDTEFSIRFPSALAGVLTVPAAFLLVRQLLQNGVGEVRGNWLGLISAGLIAVSELHVHEARQARMYTFGTLFLLLSGWTLLRALRPSASNYYWIMFCFFTVLFLYTHNLSLFSCLGYILFGSVFLGLKWLRAMDGQSRAMISRKILGFTAAIVAIAVLYMPAGVVLIERSSETTRENSWLGPITVRQAEKSLAEAVLSSTASTRLDSAGLGMAGFIGVFMIFGFAIRRGWAGLFVGLAAIVPVAMMLFYSIASGTSLFLPRYLTFAQTACLVAIPVALQAAPRLVSLLVATFVFGLVIWSGMPSYEAIIDRSAKPGMRAAAEYILEHRMARDVIATQSVFTQTKLSYHSRNLFRSHLIAVIPSRHLHGAILLKDDEVASPDGVFSRDLSGFWFVSLSGYGDSDKIGFPVPGRWRNVETIRFAQDYWWEGEVVLDHYVPE